MTYFDDDARGAAGSLSDLAEARAVVIRFLANLREHPIGHDILDVRELPAPRATMIDAFQLLIAREPRARIRDQLKLVGILLSQYQDGVGPRLQVVAAPAPTDAPDPTPPDAEAVKRIEKALSAVEPDRMALLRLFDRAEDLANSATARQNTAQGRRRWQNGTGSDEWMTR